MAAGYDGSIRIDTSIDGRGFNSGIKGIMGSLKGLAAAIGMAFGVGAVIAFGKSAVDAASQMQGAFIGLQSVMDGQGKSFSQAKEFITAYISDGLVPATNAVAAYKNLAMRGYSTDQIQKTMIALKDASAFGRQASLSMGEAVQSATEGLKNENSILVDNSGVTKNVSLMWKDYATSIGTTVGSLTKQQKIQAEVVGIMEETRFQTGDAGKLAGTYAGQLSALGVSFLNLRVAIGNAIIPIISQVLPYIKMAVDALVVFFNQVAQIMNILFGTNVSAASAEAATAIDEVAASTGTAAEAQGNLAKNTKDAGKAAKGALAAFDQLNVLQTADTTASTAGTGGSGAGGGGGVISQTKDASSAMDAAMTDMAAKVAAWKAQMLDFLQPVREAFDRLVVALTPLGETIWAGLKWAWDNILVPLGAWTITDLLPKFLDLLGVAAKLLNSILVALQPGWQWFWDNVLKPIAEWTGGKIIDILKWLTDRLTDLSTWIDNNQTAFMVITLLIIDFAASWLFVNGAITAWAIISSIASVATYIFGAAVAFLTSPIFLVVLAVAALIAIIALLIYYWPQISAFAARTWETIQQKWAIAGWWFSTYVTEPVKKGFDNALAWVQKSWENTFTGIKDFVKNTVNTIIDFINGMIRAIAGGINAVIKGLNSIKVTIPSWIPGMGGNSWGINLASVSAPQIPRLATGAVIPPNAQFAAILGDQRSGRNIEAPESLIRQIVSEEIGKIQADIKIGFSGSLASLVRELKPYIDKENVRVGGSLIRGGTTL